MSRIFNRLGFTTLALVAGSSVVGFAQDMTTGAISGTVSGPNGALIPGAKVILDGGRGQIVRVTDANGSFKASALIPGQYNITVSAPGFETAQKLVASASINNLTPVRVVMTKAAGAVVEVIAAAQVLDTTTQTSGSTFTSETVTTLPLGRAFSSVVNLAPGVASSGVDANNPSMSGSSGLENAYVIDGVNTTGTGYGASGAYSITWGSRGTGITTDFISEVQVKTFGMDAEFGGTTGGMVNAVTKTGDNTFRGQAFAYFDLDSLQARTKTPGIIDPNQIIPDRFDSSDRQEFGFTVSGPIIKDKLFYFVGYNPIRNTQKVTQVDSRYYGYGQQFTRKQQTDTYYGKLNWIMTANQSLELSIFGDPGKDPYQALSNAMTRTTSNLWSSLDYGSSNWSLKYNGIFFNDMLVEARVGQTKNKFHQGLDASANAAFRVTDVYNGAIIHGGPGFYENKDEKNRQYDLKVTKTFGDLELKAGYSSEKLQYASGTYYQGPPGQFDPHALANGGSYTTGALVNQRYYMLNPTLVDASGNTPLSNIATYYRVTRARFSPPAIAVESPWEAYFIQAKYSLDNRLFIKAGFRWEGEDMQGRNETYKFKPADALAPRVSITWDPEGNGKNKIYAFFGKYYEKVPLDLNVRSLSQEIGTSRSDYYNIDAAGTILSNPILTGTSIRDANPYGGVAGVSGKAGSTNSNHYVGSAGFLTPVLDGTKLPYTNEYVLGWDTQINEKVKVSNRIVHRTLGRALEDMGIDGGNNLPYYIANPGENSNLIAAQAKLIDPTLGNSKVNADGSITATWPKPVRDYWAWEFEANYNSAHWAAFFNLRLSRLEGNYEGLFRNDNGQSDPNITSLYDFSSEYMQKYEDPANPDYHPRGLTGNEAFASGPLPNDRAVIVNFGGTYNWDNGFSTSLLCKIQTGTPLNKFYGLIDYDNTGELAAGGRGSVGRTPNTTTFDWSGSYTWKIRGNQSVSVRADIFNLFNASKIQTIDQNYEASVDAINANYLNALTYQTARRVRLGVKYQF
jgi:hypothetical protein